MVEVDGSDTTVRKTYSAGSTSLAVRTIVNGTENTLNWLLSDHLGSSSITTTADGTWNSEIRYSAFGETRYSSGITPTDYRYTGQLEQADVNLYYYNARYYDAALGRFIQADTIIPNPASQKSYDRYTYVNNNPVKYTDPSGHVLRADTGGGISTSNNGLSLKDILSTLNSAFSEMWTTFSRNEISRRKAVADSLIKSETMNCNGWGCVAGSMARAYMQEERVVISGGGLEMLGTDKRLENDVQSEIIDLVTNDSRYGVEAFSIPLVTDNRLVTFGDEGGGMLKDATNPNTWFVRAVNVDADVYVNEIGDIYITYEFDDILDLKPDLDNELREKSGYNKWVSRFGAIWHGYLNSSDQTQIHAEWTTFIPHQED